MDETNIGLWGVPLAILAVWIAVAGALAGAAARKVKP